MLFNSPPPRLFLGDEGTVSNPACKRSTEDPELFQAPSCSIAKQITKDGGSFFLSPLVLHLEAAVSKAKELLCPSVYFMQPWQRNRSLSSHEYGNCLILQLFSLPQPEGPSFP